MMVRDWILNKLVKEYLISFGSDLRSGAKERKVFEVKNGIKK
jgi:hypothetical protein